MLLNWSCGCILFVLRPIFFLVCHFSILILSLLIKSFSLGGNDFRFLFLDLILSNFALKYLKLSGKPVLHEMTYLIPNFPFKVKISILKSEWFLVNILIDEFTLIFRSFHIFIVGYCLLWSKITLLGALVFIVFYPNLC